MYVVTLQSERGMKRHLAGGEEAHLAQASRQTPAEASLRPSYETLSEIAR
jgi:hypothetical protein